jgi:glycosyltransferase involved in cell wall biosynthesis
VRVLHAPVNIAGQPYTLVRALRRKGLDAQLVVFKERPFVRGYDRSLHLERRRSRLSKWLVALQAFVQAAPRYDIFHMHGSLTLLYPFRWDLPILKAMGKRVVMQFWGSDVRGKDPESLAYLRHVDAIIVGSYHMLDHVPDGANVVLPGLDLSDWPAADLVPGRQEVRDGSPVRVVHAPSSRETKGTAHVLAAVQALRGRGIPLQLELVEGMPHAVAVQIYRTCDIAVDQLASGWYGVFALETMALGKPVLGYIRAENADRLEAARGVRPPVVSVRAETLGRELERLVVDPEHRLAQGRLSRSFVEQVHDIDDAAEQILAIYQQV